MYLWLFVAYLSMHIGELVIWNSPLGCAEVSRTEMDFIPLELRKRLQFRGNPEKIVKLNFRAPINREPKIVRVIQIPFKCITLFTWNIVSFWLLFGWLWVSVLCSSGPNVIFWNQS